MNLGLSKTSFLLEFANIAVIDHSATIGRIMSVINMPVDTSLILEYQKRQIFRFLYTLVYSTPRVGVINVWTKKHINNGLVPLL